MKKIYLLLAVVLIAFSSCDRDEAITSPEQKNDLSEYCGCEVRSKMSDGSARHTHYYLSLKNADTTFYNVVVSKKLFNQYDLGSIIECEEENNDKYGSIFDKSFFDENENSLHQKIIKLASNLNIFKKKKHQA